MPLSPYELRTFSLGGGPDRAEFRTEIIEEIKNSSFTIEYTVDSRKIRNKRGVGESFGFFIKPEKATIRKFGLDREVLVWCSTYPTFMAREIENISDQLEAHGSRLSRLFVVLVTRYSPDARSVLEHESMLEPHIVHISIDELRQNGLDSLLSQRLYARDVFDLAGAAVRAADFFGRRDLVDRVVADVEHGTGQIGVFGLRKVGKTSLLNRIADRLQNSAKVNVARLDLQLTTAINPSPEYTLWSLASSIYASHRSVRAIKGFKLVGQSGSFSSLPNPEIVWELFAEDIQKLAGATRRRTCIMIDEIERLYELPDKAQFVRLWRALRGLDQQHPDNLRFVVGGTSPECAEVGHIGDADNPLFNYLRPEYLGPLEKEDGEKLLTVLGAQVGLRFDEGAVSRALAETGGHPSLLRTLGSTVHRNNPRRSAELEISETALRAEQESISRRCAPIIDQMTASLERGHSDEYLLLRSLAEGRIHEFRELASIAPAEIARLEGFGLLGANLESFAMRLLQTHLASRAAEVARPNGNYQLLPPGASIGEWTVQACVASGGAADVYRAKLGEDEAAIKVFRGTSLEMLQRELDTVQGLDHVNIVKFVDAVRSSQGPALVMEFLSGSTLATYCTPSNSPSLQEWKKWLVAVLDALCAMHPREDVAQALVSAREMSPDDYQRWQRAKHGYIHRDIKPENIVLVAERGPVLIDFNIAVRAGAPVVTESHTDGYRSRLDVSWGPAVDLYSLGITFLELASGHRVHTAGLESVLEIARRDLPARQMQVIDQLLDAHQSGVTAQSVMRAASQL